MAQMINLPWLSRKLEVTDSTDPTLIGISGVVMDETKRTIIVQTSNNEITMAKDTIRFTIEEEEINGSTVGQRPEERIGKRYRSPDMRDIGVDVNKPEGEWDGSKNCPFYGNLRLRGQIITGVVSSEGMQDTVVVERQTTRYMKKFERYEKRTRRYSAHLPSCIGELNPGDNVRIMECRPLSKTVKFCVIEKGAGQ